MATPRAGEVMTDLEYIGLEKSLMSHNLFAAGFDISNHPDLLAYQYGLNQVFECSTEIPISRLSDVRSGSHFIPPSVISPTPDLL